MYSCVWSLDNWTTMSVGFIIIFTYYIYLFIYWCIILVGSTPYATIFTFLLVVICCDLCIALGQPAKGLKSWKPENYAENIIKLPSWEHVSIFSWVLIIITDKKQNIFINHNFTQLKKNTYQKYLVYRSLPVVGNIPMGSLRRSISRKPWNWSRRTMPTW